MRCATASPSAAYALPPKEKKSRLSGRRFFNWSLPRFLFLLGGSSPRRDALKRRMERIDAVEIDHSPATALIGDDLARVDVIVAFGVAEAAIGARLAHSRQPHGWRAGVVRARRQWFVRWVLLDHGLSLLTPPARSAAAF